MTSDAPDEAFVWIWLPGVAGPVVAGRLSPVGDIIEFNYGRSYLERGDAIPIYLPELPLRSGVIAPLAGLRMAGSIDDAGPDAWGQRVIMQHILGTGAIDGDPADLPPLTTSCDRARIASCAGLPGVGHHLHQPRRRQRAAGGVARGGRSRRSPPAVVAGVGSGAAARQVLPIRLP